MPQMAPLSWVILFLAFIVVYILNSAKLYFSSTPTVKTMKSHSSTSKINMSWKW